MAGGAEVSEPSKFLRWPSEDPRTIPVGVSDADAKVGDFCYVKLPDGRVMCANQAAEQLKAGDTVILRGLSWMRA